MQGTGLLSVPTLRSMIWTFRLSLQTHASVFPSSNSMTHRSSLMVRSGRRVRVLTHGQGRTAVVLNGRSRRPWGGAGRGRGGGPRPVGGGGCGAGDGRTAQRFFVLKKTRACGASPDPCPPPPWRFPRLHAHALIVAFFGASGKRASGGKRWGWGGERQASIRAASRGGGGAAWMPRLVRRPPNNQRCGKRWGDIRTSPNGPLQQDCPGCTDAPRSFSNLQAGGRWGAPENAPS